MIQKVYCLILIFITSYSLKADEGMWLPQLLSEMNHDDMQAAGLKLTAEDLYSINKSSLKDAIVSLNGGSCTGEMISSEGLMLTNHHCAYGSIQSHSTLEDNYLDEGFWAMDRSQELPNEGYTVSFLVSIIDVTERVLTELGDDVIESDRNSQLRNIFNSIAQESTEGTDHTARVKSFFGGNQFYLMTYISYKDVRLVGAPPSSIGKYGGDTDNWMWPRHTGDFTLFRVYCAPDGTPAEYSPDNIPFKPKHHLPIQLEGVDNGDYTMIFGYPGSTDRYLTSYGVKQAIEVSNPTTVEIRDKKLEIMKKGMDLDNKVKIQYASKYARTSNYWKYFIGQTKGLKRMQVYEKKVDIENHFREWITSGDEERFNKYSNALDLIEEAYDKNKEIQVARTYLNEAIFQGAEIMYFSFLMNREIGEIKNFKLYLYHLMIFIKTTTLSLMKNYLLLC